MSYYATDAEVGAAHFNGETVPGDNTVPSARHTLYKDRAQNKIKQLLGKKITDDAPTDEYGDLKEGFLYLYGILLEQNSLALTEAQTLHIHQLLNLSRSVPFIVTNKWEDVYGSDYAPARRW